jgi:hypothetical protein
MKTLVALLLSLAVLVVPVAGDPAIPNSPAAFASIAEWAGCQNVTVSALETGGRFNAFFGVHPITGQPVIVFLNADSIPDQHRFTVFLHELAHCLQWGEGYIDKLDSVTLELDADGRAAQLACALGMDGPRMVREAFEWMRDTFGYQGDPGHGTLAQRIAQGKRGESWCSSVQTPFRA